MRRGEKGTTIQYWKWEGTRPRVDDTGAPRLDEQGNPQTERVQYTRPRVFTATVFNAEQVDGLAPASVSQRPPEWERHDKAELILKASRVSILHMPQARAYYSLQHDHIVLPLRSQFPTADGYHATGLHEVGHSSGHPSRLNRDLAHPFGSEPYAGEELRAEIASLMMGDELGIGHDPGQHIAYVGSWIKVLQDDPLEVFRAAAAAEKIRAYVLGLSQQHTERQEQTPSTQQDTKMNPWIVRDRWNAELKPHGLRSAMIPADPRQEFASALREAGLVLEGEPEMVGVLHRVPVEGDQGGKLSGAYVGYLDGHPAGFLQNYKTGLRTNWKSQKIAHSLSDVDRRRLQRESAARQTERLQRREEQQLTVATRARLTLTKATVRQTIIRTYIPRASLTICTSCGRTAMAISWYPYTISTEGYGAFNKSVHREKRCF